MAVRFSASLSEDRGNFTKENSGAYGAKLPGFRDKPQKNNPRTTHCVCPPDRPMCCPNSALDRELMDRLSAYFAMSYTPYHYVSDHTMKQNNVGRHYDLKI